ncbi:hypothetical protein HIM_04157 [Hirsutella minnesotensis 3608]|uniref:FAD-binding PCMH-type domain-containing protein n=1 Tax=Hirsutella minnesotensis 3608 TaxID=1043627 RepID=A0A0F7ZVD6_9HYPO|nr:hypothetical protein HIM_04157 [Hirsutella minnesotensis 3608]
MANRHETLRKLIKTGAVFTPDDEGYAESLVRWSRAAIKPAAVVAQVGSAEEASAAVTYATSNDIPLVVMGGGHSTSGSSSIDDGLVIDLRRLNSVLVNPEARTVTFGGGCKWIEVDAACYEHGLATVGGTVNHTGVGGLTLGGGFGWLSSKYGLTVDNLISAQVVLADGQIVRASDEENQDLFWAIRGAGQNFGVVTSFTAKAYPQGEVWAGPLIFTLDKMRQVVDFANWFHEHNTGDESFWFGPLGAAPGVPTPIILCMVFMNGTQADGEAFYRPLLDLGPVANMAKQMPYKNANDRVPNRHEELRRLQGGASIVMPLDAKLVERVINEFVPFVTERNIGLGSGIIFEIFPYRKICEVPRDATAFPSRGPFYHTASMFTWSDQAMDDEIRQFNRKMINMIREKGFLGNGGQYNNYDGEYLDPNRAFGQNLQRLQELKKKYDKNNVFSKWHSVWPATAS